MGNGTKVALVALLILMVVVIARFVRDDSEDSSTAKGAVLPGGGQKGAVTAGPTGKVPATDPGSKSKVVTAPPGAANRLPARPAPPVSVANPLNLVTSNTPTVATGNPNPDKPAPPPGASQPKDPEIADASSVNTPGGALGPNRVIPQPLIHVPAAPGASGSVVNPASPPRTGTIESMGSFEPLPGARDANPVTSQLPNLGKGEKVEPLKPGSAPVKPGTDSAATKPAHAALDEGLGINPTPGIQHGSAKGPSVQLASFPQTHTIEKGEGYWAIAQHYYKNGAWWPQIEKANPGVKLIPGNKLTIPTPLTAPTPLPAAEKAAEKPGTRSATKPSEAHRDPGTRSVTAPGSSGGSTDYVVKKGDTLTLLAKKFYNDSTKFHLIQDANENLKYQSLQEGSRIKIPAER